MASLECWLKISFSKKKKRNQDRSHTILRIRNLEDHTLIIRENEQLKLVQALRSRSVTTTLLVGSRSITITLVRSRFVTITLPLRLLDHNPSPNNLPGYNSILISTGRVGIRCTTSKTIGFLFCVFLKTCIFESRTSLGLRTNTLI